MRMNIEQIEQAPQVAVARTGLTRTNAEIANSATHALGALLSLVAMVVLLVIAASRGDALTMASFAVYGVSLAMLYTASALYHGLDGPTKGTLRLLDHSSIYLLIAGTYTPICLLGLGGVWGWTLFSCAWAMALSGIIVNIFLLGKSRMFDRVGVGLYIGMGWLAVVAIKPMLERLPVGMLLLILAGGILYTLGVVFYAWKRFVYHHAVWHLFVLGGSTCHFLAVLIYLTPPA